MTRRRVVRLALLIGFAIGLSGDAFVLRRLGAEPWVIVALFGLLAVALLVSSDAP